MDFRLASFSQFSFDKRRSGPGETREVRLDLVRCHWLATSFAVMGASRGVKRKRGSVKPHHSAQATVSILCEDSNIHFVGSS